MHQFLKPDIAEVDGLQVLWEDDERIIFRRAISVHDKMSAVLMAVPVAEHPSRVILDRLAHELALRDELDGAWALRPLDLHRERGRTMLLLEDPGGEPLARQLCSPLELGRFLRLAIGAAVALGKVHQRGLIHKDIKPAHIMVDCSDGKVRLTGFGIASRLPRERQAPEPFETITGTLAYMAPEQSGRMNRSVDARSDLYSLGVTFYEMLTGALPFTARDSLEWMHCHIALQPPPPNEHVAEVPAQLSAIVLKLLAKTAEARYQTAAGLEADLQRCLRDWISRGHIDLFPLGSRDISNGLPIPETLYGRKAEIDIIVSAFDRVVANGAVEFVLVSGYSGAGKSSVVNELQKVLIAPRGMFAAGKFDQYKRDIPYATLVQAFQGLVRPLLVMSDAELAVWRDALLAALAPNARLMTDLIPELRAVIGEQPAVPALGPQQAQHRFQLVFRRFISVFATPEHPLALFLDDLQWLDTATLDLLEDVLTRGDLNHLMLIGAYRDNEVDTCHPLRSKLEAIRDGGGRINELALAPLGRNHIHQLVADTLDCEPDHASPLAELVFEKTGGNPFFTIQFLSSLFEEGLLLFDHAAARWSWNLKLIHAKGYTDNVVDLMVSKLARLPLKTQRALPQLACLGNAAEGAILGIVLHMSEDQVHSALWPALRQQFIGRLEGRYRFIHDRVQEAAYSLIPAAQRADVHLRIGRLLLAQIPEEQRGQAIFEIVNQLNRGVELMTARDEREELAQYNLRAGLRAKSSVAYASALSYFTTGGNLLADDDWQRRHELWFALKLNQAECEFLTGQLATAEQHLLVLAERAQTAVEQAEVACFQLDVYTFLDQNHRAVEVCVDYLRGVGIECTAEPTDDEVRAEYERIWNTLGDRTIEELIDLPLMNDPASLAVAEVLGKLPSTAAFTAPNLAALAICKAINFTLERGLCHASCLSFVFFGRIAGPRFNDYHAGWRFAQLGYDLVEQRGFSRFGASTIVCFAVFVVAWMRHIRAACDLVRRAFEVADSAGDLTYGAFARTTLHTDLLFAGEALPVVQREAEQGLEYARKARFPLVIAFITTHLALVRMLRGLTPKFGCFDGANYQELSAENMFAKTSALAVPACDYWIKKLQARYLAGHYTSAIQAAANAQKLLSTSPGIIVVGDYHFYSALAHAAHCDSLPASEREARIDVVRSHQEQLQRWAEIGPENFEHRATLVRAELARLLGNDADAMRGYELAKRSARENAFIHIEALVHELASRFYASRGCEDIAQLYWRKARSCYQQWGADGKVRELDQIHPELRDGPIAAGPKSTIDASVEHLDLTTVLRISQAVSGEIMLEKLMHVLLRIAIEHAGAERGLLILTTDGDFKVRAEARISEGAVSVEQGEFLDADFPKAVIQYVTRTMAPVILDDASRHDVLSSDDYVRRHRARSILGLPLVKHGKLVALLYLENHLTPHAFTADRVAVLELVASQAANSLENARLYAELIAENRERKRAEDELRRSEAELLDAQQISHTGSWRWTPETGVVTWSAELRQIIGVSVDAPASAPGFLALVHEEDRPAFEELLERAVRERCRFSYEYRMVLHDGSIKYGYSIARPEISSAGQFEFIGVVMDVTERRRNEEALRAAQAELLHMGRLTTMGELAASFAHEMNQPLAAIVTNGQVGLRWLDLESPVLEEVRDALSSMVRDAIRAAEVIQGLRGLARKSGPQPTAVDINKVVRDVLAITASELQRHRVSLRTELDVEQLVVVGDGVQLQQILLNLILNALDAMKMMPERARELRVFSMRGPSGVALIGVADTGIGLDPDAAQRIFDPFFTTKTDGLGLGLSICRSIIEAHKGRLWASANEPNGAIFQFTVPTSDRGLVQVSEKSQEVSPKSPRAKQLRSRV
ncbi:AAA family ATPase [Mesorhizobium sp. LNHC209A00]|uniref:trifunctional serine/threonine-protein kinase/ATP-binding protein/sensor histidine kinase n=1 Tax=Mesorhizobium TaxID=68287 RepID=UPI0003D02EE6|nr:AAA family ATPase [Mesorhizobium sp. LNHC209A00]ESY94367.1 protein kinase [Mesorhizobium sp. LNHC209A00]